jgi:hypothetical protein
MAKVNFDGVLEAAHFKPDGQLDWVRVYVRKGAVFSDCILLSRQAFIDQLRVGRRFMVGERILNMGGNFNVTQPVRLLKEDGKRVIVTGDIHAEQDELVGVPVI